MHVYFTSLAKTKRLDHKIVFHMVWPICGGHVGEPKLYTNTSSPCKVL